MALVVRGCVDGERRQGQGWRWVLCFCALSVRMRGGAPTFLSDDRGRDRCDVGLRRRHPHLKGAFACPHRHARRGQRPWATVQRSPRVKASRLTFTDDTVRQP